MKKAKLLLKVLFCATVFSVGISSCSEAQNEPTTFESQGIPSNNMGKNGDRCVDSLTQDVYEKQNGEWVLIQHGTPAQLSGRGQPSNDLGVNGDFYTDTETNILYRKENGKWVVYGNAVEQFEVRFDLNGGSLSSGNTEIPPQIVAKGGWAKEPEQPTMKNATFDGWYPNGNLSQNKWSFTNAVMGDLNLVAEYAIDADSKVTITVDPGNGGSTYTYEGMAGTIARLQIPTKEGGYNFVGWFFVDPTTGEITDEQFNGTIQSTYNNRMIRAKYEKSKFQVTYRIEANDEVTITGLVNLDEVNVVIPRVVEGRRVTAIDDRAFNNRVNLTSITIPDTVKTFSAKSVTGTARLQNVTVDPTNPYFESVDGVVFTKGAAVKELVLHPIKHGDSYTVPAGVKKIGDYAFYGGSYSILEKIYFNDDLVEIGNNAFYMNPLISNLTFPSSLRKIGNGAFNCISTTYNSVLTNVTFNDGLEEIGDSAFVGAYFKDAFKLPSTVKSIGSYAFTNCTAITKFTFPRDLETLGFNAFSGATGIRELDIEAGNTHFKVEDNILYDYEMKKVVMCPSGRTDAVNIPNSVTEIGDGAFYMVDECQEYNFPTTLTRIGKQAFAHCYHLRSFTIPDSVTEIGVEAFDTCEDLTTLVIGTGIDTIPEYAFADCSKLTSITIPGNVKTIENDAFVGCSSVTSLTFNEGLTTIGNAAFMWTTAFDDGEVYQTQNPALTAIELPNSLVSIGSSAFANQGALTTVQFGNSLQTVGQFAFGSTGLQTITLSAGNNNLAVENDKILYNKAKTELIFAAPTLTGSVTLPSTLRKIDDFAFYDTRNISSINFQNTQLEEIGEGAFYYSRITTVSFGSSLRTIKDGAFSSSYIENLTFEEGVETIGESAFSGIEISTLVLPNSLQTIGTTAFAHCTSLTSVQFGNGLVTLGERAFQDCFALTGTITLPASLQNVGINPFVVTRSVASMGAGITNFAISGTSDYLSVENGLLMDKEQKVVYSYAIGNAQTELVLPETVEEIGDYAFTYASHIQRFTLSPNLKKIGADAFAYMTSVSSIDIPASVTYIGKEAFGGWGLNSHAPKMNFNCTEDYAIMHFDQYYMSGVGSNAKITYKEDEE